MAPLPLSLVHAHLPDVVGALGGLALPSANTLTDGSPWWVLIEVTSPHDDADAQAQLAAVLADAQGISTEGASLSQTLTQRAAMWRLREAIPMAEKIAGRMVKHDIGVPTSRIAEFIANADQALRQAWPETAIVCFGHLGDGNLHFNVQPPCGHSQEPSFEAFERAVNTLVFDAVQACGGTISAEHGIGELRKHELAARHPAAALASMRAIKQALDPQGVMNPGRMLAPPPGDGSPT